ncbi:MAG: hypothetical protein R2764_12110 [Bacteroidales bacterium]
MKTKVQLSVIAILIAMQAISQSDLKNYSGTAKVHYNDGRVSKVNLKTINDSLYYTQLDAYGWQRQISIDIRKVEKIEIPKFNPTSFFIGGAAGAAVGVATILIVESNYERTRQGSPPDEIPWHCDGYESVNEYDNGNLVKSEYKMTMAFAPKFLMFAGSTGLGLLIGSAIKKWVPFYPIDDKTKIGFKCGVGVNRYTGNMEIQLSYNF